MTYRSTKPLAALDYGNSRAFANDAAGFTEAYDKAQQYVNHGEDAGCFFIN